MGLKRITTLNNYLQNEGEKGIIVKNLFVDISKNVKYVTLSSAIILENRSSISLKF